MPCLAFQGCAHGFACPYALQALGRVALKSKGSHSGAALQKHDEAAAEKIVAIGLRLWQLPDGKELRETTRKGDLRKVAMAILVKRHTSVSNKWLAQRLGMGHDRSVSRLIKQGKDHDAIQQRRQELSKMLPCED